MFGDWACQITGRIIPAPRGHRRCRVCAGGRCLAAVRLRRGEKRLGGGRATRKPRPLSWGSGRPGPGAGDQEARPARPSAHGLPDVGDQPATPAKEEPETPGLDDDADALEADRAFYGRGRAGAADDPDDDHDDADCTDDSENNKEDNDNNDDEAAALGEEDGEAVAGAGDDVREGGDASASDAAGGEAAGESWPLADIDDREPEEPRDTILGWDCAALDQLGKPDPRARGRGDSRPLGGPLDDADDELDDPLDDDLVDGPEGPVAA